MAENDHTYKKIEIVGTSPISSDDAIRNAIAKAGKSVRGMSWFEIVELRGAINDNEITHWQATVRIGFRLED
ncbi:MAG: dodecin domain-containing protein [Planctomycetaceae bacterium]|nr:dodecin domain-containing protein [Planctomycetaceae bacterium]